MSVADFPPLRTFACEDALHAFCDGSGMDEQRRTVKCQCKCHERPPQAADRHVDSELCWCRPKKDWTDPAYPHTEVWVHRYADD